MTRLHRLSTRFVQAGELSSVLDEVVETAIVITRAAMGNLQLLDPQSGELRIAAHRGHEQWWLDYFRKVQDRRGAACAVALHTKERVVIEDVIRSPVFAGTPALEVQRRAGIQAVQSTPLLSSSGELVGVVSTHFRVPTRPDEQDLKLLDVLARQTAEMLERHATEEKLRESDRRKTEFLAILSHELRNPLAPIRNSVFLLEHAPAASDRAARAREILRRQTDHLTRLIEDLVDVTRISRGKITLQRSQVDLRDVVRKTLDDHRAQFAEGEVTLQLQEPPGPVFVNGDPVRLAQVVGNLLGNALKFTPAGGSVTVALDSSGGEAVLSVRDTGSGIEPDQLRSIFEPFSQGRQGIARTEGGLGLGLSLVRGFVDLHGGAVRATSEGSGRGSEFVVTLPLTVAPWSFAASLDQMSSPSRAVLVIEDNDDAAESLRDVLELSGHRVAIARDGRSGIIAAGELKPDVILCDLGLPDIDGYAVARAIRSDPGLRETLMVAVTGYTDLEHRQQAIEAGFDAHLAKPPALEALLALVGRAVPGDRTR